MGGVLFEFTLIPSTALFTESSRALPFDGGVVFTASEALYAK
jgi:hypothetical protein